MRVRERYSHNLKKKEEITILFNMIEFETEDSLFQT